MLCAAVFNACVMPSAALLAAKRPVTKKQQAKQPVKPPIDQKTEEEETEELTIPEKWKKTWQKVINREFKSLNRADAWNLGISICGTILAVAATYFLFRSKTTAGNNFGGGPAPHMPDDQPNIIPEIPITLQDIKDDPYGLGYEQKIKYICNEENRKKCQVLKLDDPRNQLRDAIAQLSNPSIEDKKQLVDRYYDELQKILEKKNSIDLPLDIDNKTTGSTIKENEGGTSDNTFTLNNDSTTQTPTIENGTDTSTNNDNSTVVNNTNTTTATNNDNSTGVNNTNVTTTNGTTGLSTGQEFLNALDDISLKSTSNKQVTVDDGKTTNTNAQNDTIVIPLPDPQKEALIQTLAQSGNSCAYHALKNATDLLKILAHQKIKDLENNFNFEATIKLIGNNLCRQNSIDKVNKLFNEKNNSGEWREIIRERRTIPALKPCIKEKLLQSVPRLDAQQIDWENAVAAWEKVIKEEYEPALKTWNDGLISFGKELSGEYCKHNPKPQRAIKPILPLSTLIEGTVDQRFNNIAQACASQLANTNVSIALPSENIDLQDLLVDIIRRSNPSLLNAEGIEENYRQCIALLNPALLKQNFGNEIDQNELLSNSPRRNELIKVNDLSDDELERLIENGKINNAADISIVINSEQFMLNELPAIKIKMDTHDTCAHAFIMRSGFSKIIRTLQDERRQANTGTHWICVVLYRVNRENHYIIADSFKGDKFNAQLRQDIDTLIAQLDS